MSALFEVDNSYRANVELMSLQDYVDLCKTDRLAFASPAERLLQAIGQPEIIDTSNDPRLSRIHSNRKIRSYRVFADFYGIESAIEQLVSYLRANSNGLEESRQILYLKGPVGSAKSSLVERLKDLMQVHPIYVLYDESEDDPDLRMSPVLDSPLSLFNTDAQVQELAKMGITVPLPRPPLSGWAQQKLLEFNGQKTRFKVAKIYPNKDRQLGIMKVEPGDENNQDVSVLIGKTDLRRLDRLAQNHPYSYSYSGGLNRTNQGLMDFAEMFKANIKTLNPLLMATQEHSYNGTEAIPSMPYTGIILAHSNEAEWYNFRNNKSNEAFLDRVFIVNVPYCLRYDEEIKIYDKMLSRSALAKYPIAPGTLKLLAQWSVLTRLQKPDNSPIQAKLRVYNGDNVKDTMPNAKPLEEYRDAASLEEGMKGMSTRFAYKVLSATYDIRPEEVQANPIDLMFVLEDAVKRENLPKEQTDEYIAFIKDYLHPEYFKFVEKELRTAYLESFNSFGQNMFERYVLFAGAWIDDEQCRDPETHVLLDRENLNRRLEEIEKASGIVNVKDFRHDIVHYVLKYKSRNEGKSPSWDQYEKIKTVIEKRMFTATEQIMPVIAFGPKQDREMEEKHRGFVERMIAKGYTEQQVKVMVSWFSSNRKAG